MPGQIVYEYAVLRLVPRVDREEFINIGVAVFSKEKNYLGVKSHLDEKRAMALYPGIDLKEVQCYLDSFHHIAAGHAEGGPIALYDLPSRFRWLTARRSTVVQISPIHSGLSEHPEKTLERLFTELV
ncbi:MAG: DUF3037 domain-containing protein [Saprospiraceae bacterium]|nr:DUF3037 domain-containing protein [Saprospiraceae bacterium]